MSQEPRSAEIPHAGPVVAQRPQRHFENTAIDRIRAFYRARKRQLRELWRVTLHYSIDVIRYQGVSRSNDLPLSVIYIGTGVNQAYWLSQLFTSQVAESLEADRNPWLAKRLFQRYQDAADLILLDLPWPVFHWVKPDGALALPPWINTKISLADQWQAVLDSWTSNVRAAELRKIRKNGLTYRLANDAESFRRFYREYYVPFLDMRFSEAAYIEPEEKVVAAHEHAEIIEILKGDQVIAASVIIEYGHELGFPLVGAPTHLSPKESDGAFAALYYYIIRLAYERGFSQVDCLNNRPLLNDGVLRYKRRWGARISGVDPMDGLTLWVLKPGTRALSDGLSTAPLIIQTAAGLVGLCLAKDPVTAESLNQLIAELSAPGLVELRVALFQDAPPADFQVPADGPPIKLVTKVKPDDWASRLGG